jgi:hypothetical protein
MMMVKKNLNIKSSINPTKNCHTKGIYLKNCIVYAQEWPKARAFPKQQALEAGN